MIGRNSTTAVLAATLLASLPAGARGAGELVSEADADAMTASGDAAKSNPRTAAARYAIAAFAYGALLDDLPMPLCYLAGYPGDCHESGPGPDSIEEKRLTGKRDAADRKKCDMYETAADGGDPWGLLNLALCFTAARGREEDDARGMALLRRAADMGDARAMHELGWQHQAGRNTKRDPKRAAEWYLRAADKGDADSMDFLSSLYGLGEGVPLDMDKSIDWARKARAARGP